jgi:hypothetical protein
VRGPVGVQRETSDDKTSDWYEGVYIRVAALLVRYSANET